MDGGCAHFSKLFYEEGEKLLFSTKKPKKKSSNTMWPCSSFHAFMAKHFTGVRRTCTGIQHTALLCTLDVQACAALEAHSNHAETVHCPKDCNDPIHSVIKRHTYQQLIATGARVCRRSVKLLSLFAVLSALSVTGARHGQTAKALSSPFDAIRFF